MTTKRNTLVVALAGLLGACGGTQAHANPPSNASDEPAGSSTGAVEPDAPEHGLEDAGNFEVHEWGLFQVHTAGEDVATTEGLAAGVLAGPERTLRNQAEALEGTMLLEKPVLYFHLHQESPVTVDVAVSMVGSEVVEHYPPADVQAARVRWQRVQLRPNNCDSPHFPMVHHDRDEMAGGDAPEINELVHYATADGACLDYHGIEYDHLFYRLAGRSPQLPLQVVRTPDGAVQIRWLQPGVDMGAAFRVRRRDGVLFSGEVIPFMADQVELPRPDSHEHTVAARTWFGRVAGAIGLSEDEVRVFAAAWDDELFADEGDDRDSVVFFLPPDLVQTIVPLEVTPTPARTVRVMALRILL